MGAFDYINNFQGLAKTIIVKDLEIKGFLEIG